MIINFSKNLRLASDERQYILQERKKVNRTNKETEEVEITYEWCNKGYYGDIKWVLRAIPDKLLKRNDDIKYIKGKLDDIYDNIDTFEDMYKEDIRCLKAEKLELEDKITELKNKIKELEKEN